MLFRSRPRQPALAWRRAPQVEMNRRRRAHRERASAPRGASRSERSWNQPFRRDEGGNQAGLSIPTSDQPGTSKTGRRRVGPMRAETNGERRPPGQAGWVSQATSGGEARTRVRRLTSRQRTCHERGAVRSRPGPGHHRGGTTWLAPEPRMRSRSQAQGTECRWRFRSS